MVTMISLFPGETGMVYKGLLMNWKEPVQEVAVKTLKGVIKWLFHMHGYNYNYTHPAVVSNLV